MSNFFITGIGTDVGKTVVAAIVTQALQADYWKPIQSGLQEMDSNSVKSLVNNAKTNFHPEAYQLKTPMSPHEAARRDGVEVQLDKIRRPSTTNHLVIEGAGGLLVPINDRHTIVDLIEPGDKVILVSAGYLGSINHTLLSVELLKSRGITCAGIVYNHVDLDGTIEIIEKMTGVPTLGHIHRAADLDQEFINHYAAEFRSKLLQL